MTRCFHIKDRDVASKHEGNSGLLAPRVSISMSAKFGIEFSGRPTSLINLPYYVEFSVSSPVTALLRSHAEQSRWRTSHLLPLIVSSTVQSQSTKAVSHLFIVSGYKFPIAFWSSVSAEGLPCN